MLIFSFILIFIIFFRNINIPTINIHIFTSSPKFLFSNSIFNIFNIPLPPLKQNYSNDGGIFPLEVVGSQSFLWNDGGEVFLPIFGLGGRISNYPFIFSYVHARKFYFLTMYKLNKFSARMVETVSVSV